MNMRIQSLLFVFILLSSLFDSIFSAAPPIEQQCSTEFSKLMTCLYYATGKAVSPSAECCTTVKDIRNQNPVCLCIVIQQTHKGQSTLKQMGIQEAKLLQLPSTCKLVDAPINQCPKLLNIPPSSPDYAFFTNSSSAATSNSTASMSATSKDDSSVGFVQRPHLVGPTMTTIAITIVISIFPTGFVSMFPTGE